MLTRCTATTAATFVVVALWRLSLLGGATWGVCVVVRVQRSLRLRW